MRIVTGLHRSLPEALGLGRPLLARAERDGRAWMAASVVTGPAIVLGAAQRAGRVAKLDPGTAVWRRATAGTAAYVGERAILWTLALPHVAALVPDATPRTLLNRNVRGFLAGFSRAGAIAHYFGREWISVRKRPAAALGFEATERGAVLIEVIAGIDAPTALPAALASEEERSLDRWLGKAPAALGEVIEEEAEVIAREVMRTVALRAASEIVETEGPVAEPVEKVTGESDPVPEGMERGPLVRVPIGWLDTAVERASGRVWLGGDVLAPRWALEAIAAGGEIGDAPIDGASVGDLVEAARAARAGKPTSAC